MEHAAAARWLARLAFAAAGAAVVLLFAGAGLRASLGLLLTAAAGAAASLAGAWWFLAHRRVVRWLGGAMVVLAPAAVVGAYGYAGLLRLVVPAVLLWVVALAAGRRALTGAAPVAVAAEDDTPPPRHPFLIMNPRSGGGKVRRFRLAGRARALGAEVCLVDGPDFDVQAAARRAVRDGCDLLGVAGGDGTQALVAAVAAECGVPFLVIPAGTRNHFAADLGLDRERPDTALQALTDGVELRVDLGDAGGRPFVNNASFGAYAAVVASPAYRADKLGTALRTLPGVLPGGQGPSLRLTCGTVTVLDPRAVLVSNNVYRAHGRRPRLDEGVLGVLSASVRDAAGAAGLLSRRRRAAVIGRHTAAEAVLDADTPTVAAGLDGEAIILSTPVRCTVRPAALRVRVPRRRPGVRVQRAALDWRRLCALAFPFIRRG